MSNYTLIGAPAIIKSRPRRWLEGLRSYFSGAISLKDPALNQYFGNSSRASSGIAVTPANAFTFSAVYDAVNQISSDVAKLPLNLRKRNKQGGSDPFEDSKTFRLLKYEPNPEMGSMVFRRTITAHALTWHGGFAEIERDGAGRPSALWPLAPDRVKVERYPTGRREIYFRVRNDDNSETIVESADMLHLVGLGYDPYCAYSTIALARQAIGLGLAAEQFGSTFFGNGTTFGGVLSMIGINTEEEANRLREVIKKRYTGPERANELLVTWGDMKFTPTGVAPQNAQMNELRSKQVEEVARFFNIPVHKLKNLEHATFSNIEQQDLEYYKGCLLNWITLWEEECNRKLVPALEQRQQFVKHNANAFLRADTAARTALYTALLDRGVFNANQVLELEDLNPQPGSQGELFLVQGAMVPKDQIVDLVEAQIESKSTPPAPPAPPTGQDQTPPAEDQAARALAALTERADRADAFAAEARASVEVERAARTAAETNAAVSAEAKAAAIRQADAAESVAARAEVVAGEARAEAKAAAERTAAAERAAVQAARAAEDAETRRLAAETTATEAEAARQRLEDTATFERTRQQENVAAVMASHRAMVADVMRRMLDREAERLRRAQATPEKLREWMARWYDGHEALIAEALRPVLAVSIAWTRSGDDPQALAAEFAATHVALSRSQIEGALDAPDLPAAIAEVLRRWDSRAEVVADAVAAHEVQFVQHAR